VPQAGNVPRYRANASIDISAAYVQDGLRRAGVKEASEERLGVQSGRRMKAAGTLQQRQDDSQPHFPAPDCGMNEVGSVLMLNLFFVPVLV
jgi:hypothetical protein